MKPEGPSKSSSVIITGRGEAGESLTKKATKPMATLED